MTKQKRKEFHKSSRKWLNRDPDMLACMAWTVTAAAGKAFSDGTLTLRDCNRQIELYFSISPEDQKKSLAKLKKIEDTISEFRKNLEIGIDVTNQDK